MFEKNLGGGFFSQKGEHYGKVNISINGKNINAYRSICNSIPTPVFESIGICSIRTSISANDSLTRANTKIKFHD